MIWFNLLEHLATLLTQNKLLAQKLLTQGYRYHKLHKTFSKLYFTTDTMIWYLNSMFKFMLNGLISLLRQGLSEPEFYGDIVYK